jgi:hypothetical protein
MKSLPINKLNNRRVAGESCPYEPASDPRRTVRLTPGVSSTPAEARQRLKVLDCGIVEHEPGDTARVQSHHHLPQDEPVTVRMFPDMIGIRLNPHCTGTSRWISSEVLQFFDHWFPQQHALIFSIRTKSATCRHSSSGEMSTLVIRWWSACISGVTPMSSNIFDAISFTHIPP